MIELTRDDITSASGGSKDGGKSFVRTLFFKHGPDDTMVDLINNVNVPAWNDCHPIYTAFFVTDIGSVETFSDDEWYIEVTYSDKLDNGSTPATKETEPWNLPPQNFKIHTFDKQVPMTHYWDSKSKNWKELKNSAGSVIIAQKTVTVGVMSFTMNLKKGSSIPSLNAAYLYNDKSVKVCGINIPAYCGKLLPFSATLHTVNDSKTGKVKYEYYAIDVVIHYIIPTSDDSKESWAFSMLDVGTMCKDDYDNLGPIYKFHKLGKNEHISAENVAYGTMEDLIRAKLTWVGPEQDFPWEEVTEPMPLSNGKVYLAALKGTAKYDTIDGFDSRPASWNKFHLPSTR